MMAESQAVAAIDLGPGTGHHGGRAPFTGTPRQLIDGPHSTTACYLRSSLTSTDERTPGPVADRPV